MNKYFLQITVCSLLILSIMPVHAARYVSHKTVSTDVERVDGREYFHIITSDNGIVTHEFSIDGVPVQEDDFYKSLDAGYVADLRKDRTRRIKSQESRISFIDESHSAILEKVIKNTIFAAKQAFKRLSDESLNPYLTFSLETVHSYEQFKQMKEFLDASDNLIKDMAKEHDLTGLQKLFQTIEPWPDRFEACFKNSVRSAMAKCDDTKILKELLTLVSSS